MIAISSSPRIIPRPDDEKKSLIRQDEYENIRFHEEGVEEMDEGDLTSNNSCPSSVILDDLDFDDFFLGFDDGDLLPDLELDPEMLGELQIDDVVVDHDLEMGGGDVEEKKMEGDYYEEMSLMMMMMMEDGSCELEKSSSTDHQLVTISANCNSSKDDAGSSSSTVATNNSEQEELEEKRDKRSGEKRKRDIVEGNYSKGDHHQSSRTSNVNGHSSPSSQPSSKRKVKVDWTPELHRRFVQAVEQLGVDKAVPSRILEIMGCETLTRHNIASHLQKYRSHRKHLLAREAEAATWSQRRHVYPTPPPPQSTNSAAIATFRTNKDHHNMNMMMSNPCWVMPSTIPSMGYPPVVNPPPPPQLPPPPPPMNPACLMRPLHVWGHPSGPATAPIPMDHHQAQLVTPHHVWPKHLIPTAAASQVHPPWTIIPHPRTDPKLWAHHQHHRLGSKDGWPAGAMAGPLSPVTPLFTPAAMPLPTKFPPVPLHVIPQPYGMYKVDARVRREVQPQLDLQPSKESIDAAIGEILTKPWLPLPLGLKPPSIDGVLVELQRQGISKLPPTSCAN